MEPEDVLCVIPSRLGVGDPFEIKIKVRGETREVTCSGGWNTKKPGLRGQFNLNVSRRIQFMDDGPPGWQGSLRVEADDLSGPGEVAFDGKSQGVFPGDTRPIRCVGGFSWTAPGFHFIRIIDRASGLEAWSNPVRVSAEPPRERIYWGDPHWQTFFSDGIRCPEELYAFARDQGFLDFGAMADHVESVTDRQWDYFQAVTNDLNEPDRFATLVGQEWTNHNPEVGAPGHRNIYYRGDHGPVLRSDDPACNTLAKLWQQLDALEGIEALAIPHHSANVVMGVDWSQGWNPKYEKAVEIYSVWGSSEKPASAGNPRPIRSLKGEMPGRHVIDALKRGYRFGFVGGGDIHDGRPGDDMHNASYPPREFASHPQGFTAVVAPRLTRGHVYDAIRDHRTYATSKSRIYLEACIEGASSAKRMRVQAASEDGVAEVVLVRNGEETRLPLGDGDPRVVVTDGALHDFGPDEFCYVRVLTAKGNMAWSSPEWGSEAG